MVGVGLGWDLVINNKIEVGIVCSWCRIRETKWGWGMVWVETWELK